MTEAPFDRDVIQRRLREIHVQLDRLAELGEVDADRLRRDWITAAAFERVLGTIVELARAVVDMRVRSHVSGQAQRGHRSRV